MRGPMRVEFYATRARANEAVEKFLSEGFLAEVEERTRCGVTVYAVKYWEEAWSL